MNVSDKIKQIRKNITSAKAQKIGVGLSLSLALAGMPQSVQAQEKTNLPDKETQFHTPLSDNIYFYTENISVDEFGLAQCGISSLLYQKYTDNVKAHFDPYAKDSPNGAIIIYQFSMDDELAYRFAQDKSNRMLPEGMKNKVPYQDALKAFGDYTQTTPKNLRQVAQQVQNLKLQTQSKKRKERKDAEKILNAPYISALIGAVNTIEAMDRLNASARSEEVILHEAGHQEFSNLLKAVDTGKLFLSPDLMKKVHVAGEMVSCIKENKHNGISPMQTLKDFADGNMPSYHQHYDQEKSTGSNKTHLLTYKILYARAMQENKSSGQKITYDNSQILKNYQTAIDTLFAEYSPEIKQAATAQLEQQKFDPQKMTDEEITELRNSPEKTEYYQKLFEKSVVQTNLHDYSSLAKHVYNTQTREQKSVDNDFMKFYRQQKSRE